MKTKFAFSVLAICFFILKANAQLTVSVTATPNHPCDTCIHLSGNVSGGLSPYTYQWFHNNSPFATGQNTIFCKMYAPYNGDSIRLVVTDANSQQVSYSGTAAQIFHSTVNDIDFCIVTVDSATGKSLLVWEQSTNPSTASYNIYKKNTSSVWTVIANIPRTNFSTFVDNSSNPAVASDWYNLSVVDSCGFQTPWSGGIAINTIHLSISAGIPPAWNLSWNWTQGFPITKYRIWRGTTTSIPILIDSVSNSVYAYTDLTPPSNVSKYIIEAISTANCNPTFKYQNTSSAYSSSFSNIVNTNPNGINEIDNIGSISISPNPFSGHTILQTDNLLHNATLTADNCFGQTVLQIKNINGHTITLFSDNLASGLYFLRLTEHNKIFTDKLIITDK